MPIGLVHVRELVSQRQGAHVEESCRVLGRVGYVRKHVARVPVSATALQETNPGGKAHEQEGERVERMLEVLVGSGHAGRARKESLQGRPSGLHEEPAGKELDVSEQELEARELIGKPKVREADVMEGRRKNSPLKKIDKINNLAA